MGKVIPVWAPFDAHKIDEIPGNSMVDRLCESTDTEHDTFAMDIMRYQYNHEDMTDESYDWRKGLSLEELKIVGKWDREWCRNLVKLFAMLERR